MLTDATVKIIGETYAQEAEKLEYEKLSLEMEIITLKRMMRKCPNCSKNLKENA